MDESFQCDCEKFRMRLIATFFYRWWDFINVPHCLISFRESPKYFNIPIYIYPIKNPSIRLLSTWLKVDINVICPRKADGVSHLCLWCPNFSNERDQFFPANLFTCHGMKNIKPKPHNKFVLSTRVHITLLWIYQHYIEEHIYIYIYICSDLIFMPWVQHTIYMALVPHTWIDILFRRVLQCVIVISQHWFREFVSFGILWAWYIWISFIRSFPSTPRFVALPALKNYCCMNVIVNALLGKLHMNVASLSTQNAVIQSAQKALRSNRLVNFLVIKLPVNSGGTRLISLLMIPWLLVSPGYQQT